MKALTLLQPWATLVAIGAKKIETRSFGTEYRGELLIHSSKKIPDWARKLCFESPFEERLRDAGYNTPESLPLGKILCSVYLWDVQDTRTVGRVATANELAFGDYSPGRHAWLFHGDPMVMTPPIDARGALGLWEFDTGRLDPKIKWERKTERI